MTQTSIDQKVDGKMGSFVHMLSKLWSLKLPWQKLPIWTAHRTYSAP